MWHGFEREVEGHSLICGRQSAPDVGRDKVM